MRLPGAPAVLNSDQGRVAFVMGSLVVRGVREWLFSEIFPSLLLVASLLLVVRPGAPSSVHSISRHFPKNKFCLRHHGAQMVWEDPPIWEDPLQGLNRPFCQVL